MFGEMVSKRWLRILVSMIAGTVIAYMMMGKFILPYQLKKNSNFVAYPGWFSFAHDWNKDGFGEIFLGRYNSQSHQGEIIIENHWGRIQDQLNIPGFVQFEPTFGGSWFCFGDFTGDGKDELCVFARENDSLFLYIANLQELQKQERLSRYFLLARSEKAKRKKHQWDIYLNDKRVLDVNNDGKKELVFTLVSGYSNYPRGIYIFDVEEQRIVHRFDTHAFLWEMDFWDLTGDEKKEIIVSTYASDNFPADYPYSDAYTWVFVFDAELQLLFEPRKLYGFTSSFVGKGILKKSDNAQQQSFIVGFVKTGNRGDQPNKFLLIDREGKIITEHPLPRNLTDTPYTHLSLKRTAFDSLIIVLSHNSSSAFTLTSFDMSFRKLHQRSFSEKVNVLEIADLDGDQISEIICTMGEKLLVLDSRFRTLASYSIQTSSNTVAYLFFLDRGANLNPDMLITFYDITGENKLSASQWRYQTNPVYSYRFIIALLAGVCLSALYVLFDYRRLVNMKKGIIYRVLDRNDQGIMLLDNKGRVVYVNPVFMQMLNFSEPIKESIGYQQMIPESHRISELIEKVLEKNEPITENIIFYHEGRLEKRTVRLMPMGNGQIRGYQIVLTSGKEILPRKMQIWSKSVQKLAHDIKTPLNNIAMGLKTVMDEITKTDLPNKGLLLEDLQVMRVQIRRIHSLTQNFLKYINLEKPTYQLADVNQCIENVLQQFAAYRNEELSIEFTPGSIPMFYFDPQQIEMVIKVLVENAIDALQCKGSIWIRTQLLENYLAEIPLQCEIEVTDNGPGIPKDKQGKIFEPFYTDKENGSGLGLAISRKIVEDHNGEILFTSTEKLGTTFKILLPVRNSDELPESSSE